MKSYLTAGQMGVGEMAMGETRVGELGVGRMETTHFKIVRHIVCFRTAQRNSPMKP